MLFLELRLKTHEMILTTVPNKTWQNAWKISSKIRKLMIKKSCVPFTELLFPQINPPPTQSAVLWTASKTFRKTPKTFGSRSDIVAKTIVLREKFPWKCFHRHLPCHFDNPAGSFSAWCRKSIKMIEKILLLKTKHFSSKNSNGHEDCTFDNPEKHILGFESKMSQCDKTKDFYSQRSFSRKCFSGHVRMILPTLSKYSPWEVKTFSLNVRKCWKESFFHGKGTKFPSTCSRGHVQCIFDTEDFQKFLSCNEIVRI